MNFKVKYHDDVPEYIRKKAHEFFYSKALTEELDGIAVPCTDFFNELTKIGFRAIIHDYGYEIIPLPLFIKQELEAYSGEVPHLKQILRNALLQSGLTVDEIEKYAPELVCNDGADTIKAALCNYAKSMPESFPDLRLYLISLLPNDASDATQSSWNTDNGIITVRLEQEYDKDAEERIYFDFTLFTDNTPACSICFMDKDQLENVTAPVVSKEILTYALAMLKRHSKERKDIWVEAMKMRIEQ